MLRQSIRLTKYEVLSSQRWVHQILRPPQCFANILFAHYLNVQPQSGTLTSTGRKSKEEPVVLCSAKNAVRHHRKRD